MHVKLSNGKDVDQKPEKEALARADAKPKRDRRPYQKPAFRFERVFETMALSCGKVTTIQFQCVSSQKTS
jgi:hypothetical protein